MSKLLNEGKTDLLGGFISQRTRRAFKAYLVRGKDGKTSFEFEPRKEKVPAKGKAAANADDAAEASEETKVAAKPAKKAAAKPAAKKAVAKKKAPAKKAAA